MLAWESATGAGPSGADDEPLPLPPPTEAGIAARTQGELGERSRLGGPRRPNGLELSTMAMGLRARRGLQTRREGAEVGFADEERGGRGGEGGGGLVETEAYRGYPMLVELRGLSEGLRG
eukprot:8887156-Pyramimonas_sp.AAC.1